MSKVKFTAEQFTPTTTADKAKFANQFVKFVESDFDRKNFPKWFYQRLRNTFGHIAWRGTKAGFYAYFFEAEIGKVRFLGETLAHPCYGDPTFTYSDVERELQKWLVQTDVLGSAKARLARSTEERRANDRDLGVRVLGGIMDSESILNEFAGRWNTDSKLALALEYIQRQQCDDAWRDFLQQAAEAEGE